jgi:hypothetical protein
MVFVVVGDAAFEIQVFHSAAAGDNSADDLTSASELPPLLVNFHKQIYCKPLRVNNIRALISSSGHMIDLGFPGCY